jgi:hypothetical protein
MGDPTGRAFEPPPHKEPRRLEPYLCNLLATAIMIPGVAGAISATLYLAPHHRWINASGWRAWVFGAAITVFAWTGLGLLVRRYAYANRALPGVYGELCTQFDALRCLYEAHGADDDASCSARVHLSFVEGELGYGDSGQRPGLRWTLGTGYVDVWRRLHSAMDDLLAVVPKSVVIAAALEDRRRLRGSKIANADGLVRELEVATTKLDPGMIEYFDAESPPRPPGQAPPPRVPAPAPPSADDEASARIVVGGIRRTVDQFRDGRRAGLVRARNRLFGTVIFAGITAYSVLGLGLVLEVSTTAVASGIAYYLIGGVIGLFQQLRAASAADTVTEEDYGLSIARLIHTPLFSGIAAVAGVALAVLAPVAASKAGGGVQPAAKLSQVFDIENYPAGVVVAAVFGLTPSLLIRRLQQQAEQYKADLRGSEAGERKDGPSAESSA